MSLARAEADLVSAKNDVRRYENLLDAARQRVTKLEHYIEMSRQYGLVEGDADEGALSRRQRSGVSGAAVNAVIAMLREVGKPIRTKDLVSRLKELGIVVSANPDREVTILSGYLSRAPELLGDRATGWALREWTRNEEAAEAERSTEALVAHSPRAARLAAAFSTNAAAREAASSAMSQTASSWDAPKADLDDDIPF